MTNRFLLPVVLSAVFSYTIIPGCSKNPPVLQTPPTEVVISKPVVREIQDFDEYTGLVADTGIINVVGRVVGELEENLKTVSKDGESLEGKEVKKGQLLFKIEDDLYVAILAKWQARKDKADADLKRMEPLIKKGSVSQKEYDDAKFAKAEAEAEIKIAQLNVDYCTITAEIDGRVSKNQMARGNLVDPATGKNLLTTIIPMDPIYVEFYVNERAYLKYVAKAAKEGSANEKKEIPVELGLVTDKGFPHKGVIDFAENKVDPGTGSKKVRARFPNPKNESGIRPISPGLFGKVRVTLSDPYEAILVSERAILTDQNRKYVLTVDRSSKKVVRADVALGRTMPDGLRVITAGLKADDWVIVEGVQRVRPGVDCNPSEGKMPMIVSAGGDGI